MHPSSPLHADVHVCIHCRSELVQPVTWQRASARTWELTLRCPECETWSTADYPDDACMAFDEELDRGLAILLSDLGMLAEANMEDDVERFVAALHADLVLPEDF